MALIEVKLLGELGRQFGRKYCFVADSPRAVMSALCNQLEGFKQYMSMAHEKGMGFRLVNEDPEGMDYNNVVMGCKRLIIAPIITGSGTVGRILVGVALVALAFVSFGGSVAAGGLFAGFGATAAGGSAFALGSGFLFSTGLSLVLTGIAALLTPAVQTPATETQRKDSYLFDRAAELTTQGNPVPILYGRFLVGSPLIISSAITTQQVPT
jgi:predicted phage tail protein